ncbi:MAG: type II secretion system GspH family protein [Anaerohalosphaeraceae bacterium]|nr:type II secretion system GspH family protein [Anaerohalosphaeraceae bacterium]
MIERNFKNFKNKGFTLTELIMAMSVMAIILTAVASLAFALGVANDSVDDTAEFQSRLRFTTLKITDLVKNCRLLCANNGTEVAIWENDDDIVDGKINPNELMYIEYDSSTDKVRLLEFECSGAVAGWEVSIADIEDGSIRSSLAGVAVWNYTDVMIDCVDALFTTDVSTPFSKNLAMKFDFQRNGSVAPYQISSSLRCYAGHLLNGSGEVVDDDDGESQEAEAETEAEAAEAEAEAKAKAKAAKAEAKAKEEP